MRGKFGEHQTVRSILKSLPRTVHDDVTRAGIGEDYARLLLRDGDGGEKAGKTGDADCKNAGAAKSKSVNVATGVCIDSGYMGLRLDIARLYNSVRIGGYMPWVATDTIVMPDDDERRMKKLLGKLAGICAEYGVDIITGHTEVNTAVSEPIISVTMMGSQVSHSDDILNGQKLVVQENRKNKEYNESGLRGLKRPDGMDIVMCGQTGVGGTLQLYYDNQKELFERYSESYLRPVERMKELILLDRQVDVALEQGSVYAHDISRGGVFAALWEMGDALKCGLEVCHDDIPILQETIEICEHTGDNPYMIDGCGAALFVVPDGEHLADKLYEAGYEASVIGHLTESSDRVVVHDEEMRFLTPPRYL